MSADNKHTTQEEDEKKIHTVYKHTAPNGKVYIGITSQKPEKRWDNGNGYKQNKHFYSAIRKYGWENFKHENLYENLKKEEACDLEIKLIAEYHATDPRYGYNISTGGECGALGMRHSVESRRKMSESHKGETAYWKGKHLSDETRKKIGEAKKGQIPWNKGKKGVQHTSPETRRKIGDGNKGKHVSAETRRKLSESIKRAYLNNPEYRRKISEANKGSNNPHYGKHPSAETRRKKSEALKGKNAKAVICVETGTLYSSLREAAKAIGVTQGAISNSVRGITKTSGGYHWKYAENMEESK